MNLRVRSKKEAWQFTALVTAFAVILPLAVTWTVLGASPREFSGTFVASAMVIAGIIPLFLTPPISLTVFDIIRTQAEMIRKVDARIMFDMLTGVYNRNHFFDSIRAGQASGPVMIVDADHFKSINDTHGHAVGDEALCILANAISACVGKDGLVGRLGGEEFGIFMPGKAKAEGYAKADAICSAVRDLHPLIGGKDVRLTVSIGCSYHRATKVIGHSMKEADDLLYRAKAEGRDRALCAGSETKRRRA